MIIFASIGGIFLLVIIIKARTIWHALEALELLKKPILWVKSIIAFMVVMHLFQILIVILFVSIFVIGMASGSKRTIAAPVGFPNDLV